MGIRRTKIASLIEDVVGRQKRLVLPAENRAVIDEHRAVMDRIAVLALRPANGSQHHRDAAASVDRTSENALQLVEKILPLEQILGRVSGQGALRKNHEVNVVPAPSIEPLQDLSEITLAVSDDGVDLGESDSHRA